MQKIRAKPIKASYSSADPEPPGRDRALVPFLHSAFILLPSQKNSSHFAPRRAMLPFLDNIQLRDYDIIL